MSDLMLLGVLRMPLELVNTRLAVAQLVGRAHQAADRIEADAAEIETLRSVAKHALLDADHARQERDAMQAGNETLRALLRDIMTEELIPDGYPLLMARAKAALDGAK